MYMYIVSLYTCIYIYIYIYLYTHTYTLFHFIYFFSYFFIYIYIYLLRRDSLMSISFMYSVKIPEIKLWTVMRKLFHLAFILLFWPVFEHSSDS